MSFFPRFRPAWIARALSACVIAAIASGAPTHFDIPAQSAQSALRAFNAQSGKPAVFVYDDLKGVKTMEVRGDFEPIDALHRLLDGTGFEVTLTSFFVVGRAAQPPVLTGSVKGNLQKADGHDPAGIRVVIRETGQSTLTDGDGNFGFAAVGPGDYLLIAIADGYQALHLTHVQVKARSAIRLGSESLRPAKQITELQPYVVHARMFDSSASHSPEDTGKRLFPGGNIDRPRTPDDAQPYYLFDQAGLERSGANTLEEFLKKRVSMNASTRSGNQVLGDEARPGNNSAIDLRGFGVGSTLVLVNGRRSASPAVPWTLVVPSSTPIYGQADLNGIPLAAVERVEILPSSASGIYGGSALGGVVNVILKSNFTGATLSGGFGSTWDGNAPRREGSLVAGSTLEDGRTRLMLIGSYADSNALTLADRIEILDRGYRRLARDHPNALQGPTPFVPLGATVNIRTADGSPLRLKSSGATLASATATLPANYAFTTAEALGNSVLVGQWNTIDPDANEAPNGRAYPLGSDQQSRSVLASLSHDFSDRVTTYGEFSLTSLRSHAVYNPFGGGGVNAVTIRQSAATNPFAQDILVSIPVASDLPSVAKLTTLNLTAGASIKLGGDWQASADFRWSKATLDRDLYVSSDGIGYYYDQYSALRDGLINPFDGTAAGRTKFAADLASFATHRQVSAISTLNDLMLRASGSVLQLPWGDVSLSTGLEHRREGVPRFDQTTTNSTVPTAAFITILPENRPPVSAGYLLKSVSYGQVQTTDSGYLEANIPVITGQNAKLWARKLDLQAALRFDRTTVGVGSRGYSYYPLAPSYPATSADYSIPNTPTLPSFRATSSYSAVTETLGVRYQPARELMLRAAFATAFLPPTSKQLSAVSEYGGIVTITDPQNGRTYNTTQYVRGSAGLKPQTSEAWDAGFVWTPGADSPLHGLRLGVQYNRISQRDVIAPVPPQWAVQDPGRYGATVNRDAVIDQITTMTIPNINLLKIESSSYDVTLEYRKPTEFGTFALTLLGTINEHVKQQRRVDLPAFDIVGYPSEGGPARLKANAGISWEGKRWSAGWTANYFGSYHQYVGAREDGQLTTTYTDAQGSDHVPSDIFHDVFVRYAFGRSQAQSGQQESSTMQRALSGWSVLVVVKNVFDRLPAFDAYNAPLYSSYNGDIRLREFNVTVRKTF